MRDIKEWIKNLKTEQSRLILSLDLSIKTKQNRIKNDIYEINRSIEQKEKFYEIDIYHATAICKKMLKIDANKQNC